MMTSEGFATLWEANHQKVYTGLRKCGATHQDAEDALSQATVSAWEARGRYKPEISGFYTWLGVMALRKWYKLLAREKHTIPLTQAIGDLAAITMDSMPTDEQPSLQLQLARSLLNLASQEDFLYVSIVTELIDRVRTGMPCTQAAIARALGVDRSTVCRCFAFLRAALQESLGCPEGPIGPPSEVGK